MTRLGDIAIGVAAVAALESINHYTVQRVIDVAANVDGRDLGATAADIQKAIAEISKGSADRPRRSCCAARTR